MCCTLRKSRRFLSLASLGKQRLVMAKAALSALLLGHRHREALATPTATGGDDLATRRAGHACTESVLVQALAIARLISALHWVLLAMARRDAGASTCVVALRWARRDTRRIVPRPEGISHPPKDPVNGGLEGGRPCHGPNKRVKAFDPPRIATQLTDFTCFYD